MIRTAAERTLAVGFAALAVAAAGLLAIFFASDEAIQQSIVLVDHDNSTTPLRLPLVRALQWMSLAASIVLLALGGLAYAKRNRLLEVLSIFIDDARGYCAEVAAEIRDLLAPGERWKLGALGLFFLVGLALRVAALDAPMRYDESYTFNYHGLRDVLNIISDYTTPNNHIFQSVLVHFSYQLFGASPTALRLPALLAGVLLVPASFWFLRRLFDDGAALIAAGLVALSEPLIAYSTNARGYTWLTLLFLLGFTLATRLREKRNLAVWALFVAVFVLGFFTIPVMLYGYAVVSMWMLLSVSPNRRKALFVELMIASAAVASLSILLYTPAAVRCTIQNIVANPFVRPLPFSIWATYFPQLPVGLADYASRTFPWGIRILLLVGLAASALLPGGPGQVCTAASPGHPAHAASDHDCAAGRAVPEGVDFPAACLLGAGGRGTRRVDRLGLGFAAVALETLYLRDRDACGGLHGRRATLHQAAAARTIQRSAQSARRVATVGDGRRPHCGGHPSQRTDSLPCRARGPTQKSDPRIPVVLG